LQVIKLLLSGNSYQPNATRPSEIALYKNCSKLFFGDVMANEQTSVSRRADREHLPLLPDKARPFAGEYIESLKNVRFFTELKRRKAGKLQAGISF
jgi:hypothetical protein